MYRRLQIGERKRKEVSFDPNSERMKQHYLDLFEGVKLDVIYTAEYDENSDIGTTCLGTFKIRRQDEMKTEHQMPIIEDCYKQGRLLNPIDFMTLHNVEASRSFMFKTFYLNYPSLHLYLNVLSKTKNI